MNLGTDTDGVMAAALEWIDGDPDPESSAELQALVDGERWDELTERMAGVLEFGTAGIRGAVEAGSNRMNRAVVIKTTAGLASFLSDNRSGEVVVGFDGRTSSEQFASDTIGVLAAAGHTVAYFRQPTPTPIVAFAAKQRGAAAAVVITASHNPPADNGYKVYDSNGAQIVPPVDRAIADAIARTGPAADIPRVEGVWSGASDHTSEIDADAVYAEYLAAVEAVVPGEGGSALRIAYTPIHGVGWAYVDKVMVDGGFANVSVAPAQAEPDGAFPTVAFPNPEEPGAMDEVMAVGAGVDAQLVTANDPDADRLAVALPDGDGWRLLTGNQIGVLLADWLLSHWDGGDAIVINSIVSSPMLAAVAAAHDARFEQTLTGFKWIANAAIDLEASGVGEFVFGYEEALGYSVGTVVRDKDGISALLAFARMAAEAAESGRTVDDLLEDLYRRVGLWVSTQASVVRPGSEGLAEIARAMEYLTANPPDHIGAVGVVDVTDYAVGAESRPRWLPETSLIALSLDNGSRVLVRPSGTEPKLKIYVDMPGEVGADVRASERALRGRADELAAATQDYLGF